ncbi:MAG: terpene cyclase/mutase family protein [Planctomycetaceae bacterium]|nr:terpene cyclase/mutase family protein [Planctomycetaceae bacterium]
MKPLLPFPAKIGTVPAENDAVRFNDFLYFLKQVFFLSPVRNEEETDDIPPSRLRLVFAFIAKKLRSRESAGTAVSIIVHVIILLILSFIILPVPQGWNGIAFLGGFNELPEIAKEIAAPPGETGAEVKLTPDSANIPAETNAETQEPENGKPEHGKEEPANSESEPGGGSEQNTLHSFVSGGGFGSRSASGRSNAVGSGDCSAKGENAVEKALVWLAAHQQADGGWSFDFADSCKRCRNSGTHGSRIAATGIALLPFFGAGYTHQEGQYQTVVDRGLAFLVKRGVAGQRGFELNQGTQGMYSHGIAAIALCEAYSMSKRKQDKLRDAAQESLRFIENAQNRDDGGWRYIPNEPGDLSVSAWQMMALKSGKLAELYVSQPVIYEAYRFLDEVSDNGGREYNYRPTRLEKRYGTGKDSPKTCTACGLLMRMYFGWQPGDKILDGGIGIVSAWNPLKDNDSSCNLYYAYYATLALHHYGGSGWVRWNDKIQNFLVNTQSGSGDEAGSWFFSDSYCDAGGRLLNTALAALILETPYRFMPLFRKP